MDAHQPLRDAFGRRLNAITRHSGDCPDCDADTRLVEGPRGVFRLTVFHDDTCPTLRSTP